MTIKEYLDNTKANYIKVGAKDGGGFIYCGKVSDAKSFLKEFDEPQLEKYEASLRAAKHDYEHLKSGGFASTKERLIEQYKQYRREKKKGGDDFKKDKKLEPFKSLTAYKKYLEQLEQDLTIKAERRVERATKRIQNYTELLSRDVLKVYPSILENEDGFIDEIIIYKGDEAGNAWDLTEFRRGGGDSE
jgi:hypothetical protein